MSIRFSYTLIVKVCSEFQLLMCLLYAFDSVIHIHQSENTFRKHDDATSLDNVTSF